MPKVAKQKSAFVRSLKPHSVVEQVVAEIRRSIVTGALQPEQEFSLRETAMQLGVSTAPVREALRVLQGEGLIVQRRARSAVVAPMDIADMHSIYELRRSIEPAIAAKSCLLISAADLASLDRIVEFMGDPKHSIDDIYVRHREFHLTLLRPAASAWDLRVLELLWQAAERYVRIGFGRLDLDRSEHERRESAHQKILAAFHRRDGEAARAAVAAHLARNEELVHSTVA